MRLTPASTPQTSEAVLRAPQETSSQLPPLPTSYREGQGLRGTDRPSSQGQKQNQEGARSQWSRNTHPSGGIRGTEPGSALGKLTTPSGPRSRPRPGHVVAQTGSHRPSCQLPPGAQGPGDQQREEGAVALSQACLGRNPGPRERVEGESGVVRPSWRICPPCVLWRPRGLQEGARVPRSRSEARRPCVCPAQGSKLWELRV